MINIIVLLAAFVLLIKGAGFFVDGCFGPAKNLNSFLTRLITVVLLMSFIIVLCGIGFENVSFCNSGINRSNSVAKDSVSLKDTIQTLQINENYIQYIHIRTGRTGIRSYGLGRYIVLLMYSLMIITGIIRYIQVSYSVRRAFYYIINYIHAKDGSKRHHKSFVF